MATKVRSHSDAGIRSAYIRHLQYFFANGSKRAHTGTMDTVTDEGQHQDGHNVPYTHGHHDSVLRSHRWRTAENSAGYLLPHLAPGMSLLDVGCGPGTITGDLAALVAPGRVVGLDASVEVIEEARRTAAEQGTAGLTFEVGDLFNLDYEDGTFDVVHAHQVLQHVGDPRSEEHTSELQ